MLIVFSSQENGVNIIVLYALVSLTASALVHVSRLTSCQPGCTNVYDQSQHTPSLHLLRSQKDITHLSDNVSSL